MVKRVFAIIGIVLGSALVFAGAVIGVYALMGRFRTPVVYPSRLEFVESEQTIVNDNQNGLYYFILNGYSNSENEVNQKNCFIDVLDGTDLIQLCSSNGENLTEYADENGNRYPNRYLVQCNERIYYKLKNIGASHFDDSTYGRILIQARDERGQHQSNQLTIWVDRKIDEIFIGEYNGDNPIIVGEITNEANETIQTIPIGLEVSQYFNILVEPNYSLRPISSQEEKIVEIYYFDSNEYVLIDNDNITDYNFLHLDQDTNQMYFETADAGSYTFKIAVFDTYASREAYLSDESNLTDSNFERINNMVNTTVVFNVVNSDIEEVGFESSGISFNLYDESSMTLSSLDDATPNNLGLYMLQNDRETFSRFNEVDFTMDSNFQTDKITLESTDGTYSIVLTNDGITQQAVLEGFGYNSPDNVFSYQILESDSNYVLEIYDRDNPTEVVLTLTIETSNIALERSVEGDVEKLDKILIKKFTCEYNLATIEFMASSGVTFLDVEESIINLTLLKTGSYLEFYIYDYDTQKYYKFDNIEYSVTSVGSGREKTFNIIMQNNPIPSLATSENLVLGILVVNANGESYFDFVDVNIQELALDPEFVNGDEITLNVDYVSAGEDNFVPVYDSMNFDEIVNIVEGTYDACVFVTPYSAEGNYDVEVLEGVTFIDRTGNKYVLVGTFEGGSYQNVVKVRKGATNADTTLYFIQLRNQYNQTAEEYINNIIYNENVFAKYSFSLESNNPDGETTNTNATLNVKYSIDEENNVLVSAKLVDVQDIDVVSAEIEEGLLVVELSNGQTVSEFNLVNFFIETENEQGSTQEEVVLANKTNSSGLADVVDDAVSTSREVSVSVSYSIIESEIQFNYNERNEIGGDNNIVIDNQERVNIVENTTSHVISLSAPNVQDMIKNMFNADFDSSNLSVRLYSDNGSLLSDNFQNGLLLGDIGLSEDESALIINYDVRGSLSNPDYYLRLCLTYNGKMIESAPIYIISTAPTDIDLVYTTTGSDGVVTNNEIDLSDNPSGAENSPNYINIEVSYNVKTNEYVYKYYLITEENRARILIDSTFFNATSDNNTTNGFKVRSIISDIFNPEYLPNITHNLDYTSLNPNVISFNDEGAISINSVGVVTITIESDSQSAKYLRIVVETNGRFSLNTKNSQISSNSCNLNEIINYTYDGIDISSNSQVNIENLEDTYFGGGRKLEVIENENGFTIQTETINPDDKAEIVLQVEKFSTGWTFTRERFQTANLNIIFDVITPTGSLEEVTIKFTSSITINQNNSWSNYYQGTSALLFEMSGNNTFSNNSIFRINSTTPTAGISISVTGPDNQPVNLTSSSTEANAIEDIITFEKLGNYVVSFVLDSAEIERRTITVIPNILLSANSNIKGEDSTIVSDSTYNLSDFVTIEQYKTKQDDTDEIIIYGYGLGDVYNSANLQVVDFEDYSSIFSETDISMTSNLSTNSLFTLNEENFTISTGWIQEIGSSLSETLTFNYGTYNLGLIDVTISNKYTYSLKKETTYMAETVINFANPTNTNPIGESETIELQSVEYLTPDEVPQIDVNYDISTQMFRFSTTTGHIEQLNNVILRFTFSVGGEILIYQTTIEDEIIISPYIPNELDDIKTAYSNGEYDLLRNIYDIDNINDIVSRFIVTKVSDDSAFKSTDFLGGGYDKGSETQTGLLVYLAEIVGSTKVVTITYQIKYEIQLSDGSTQSYTYTFTRDFEIQNRQSVSIQYPFGDGFVDSNASGTNLHFANELDGSNNGTFVSSTSQYNQYSVKNFKFEPVMINQTIDFDYDEIMNVSRVQVKNAVPDTIDDNLNFEISIAGWSPRSNINNYINNGNIDIDNVNKTITFNPSSTFTSGSYGYIVFRIKSTSGYLAYYYVQLYNQTGGNNNYATADSTTIITSEASCGESFVDNGAVLGKSLISTSTNLANLEFTSADFSRLEFYLLSAEMLDGSDFFNETNPNRYSKLGDYQLTDLNNYTNIKIGVVMRVSTFSILNLGVLNFYVQPIYEEVLSDTNLQHQTTITNPDDESTPISNGEYTRVITINEDEVVVPFEGVQMRGSEGNIASDPTSVEIISVNSSSDFTLDTNTNSIKNGEDVVVQIEESTIKLSKYVRNENLEFSVKYTYTIGEDETASEFVLIVHYTYNQLEINNNAVTINNIGAFDNTKFNNRVNLTEIVGDYNKTITINSLGSTENGIKINLSTGAVNGVEPTDPSYNNEIFKEGTSVGKVTYIYEKGEEESGEAESYFEFELLTNRYTRSFTVTFDDLTGENLVKTVYANVNSGIYVSFPAGSEGYSASNPLESTNIDSSYSSPNGSSITIKGNSATDSALYREYTIGGLNIKTSVESSLEFEFSSADSISSADSSYVNNLQGEETIFTISGDDFDKNNETPINFVHSAQNKDIAVTIRIKAGDDYYQEGGVNQTITFYICIAQTYQGLQAGYLINSSNASQMYENVARNSKVEDLVTTLLGKAPNEDNNITDVAGSNFLNSRRISLIGLNNEKVNLNEAQISGIGFNDPDNPNYLSFSAGNYSNVVANETDSDLFDLNILSPTNNTLSQLVISNKTGVNTTYTYQIISADSTIGIDPTIDSAGYINKTEDTTETTTRTDYATLLINDEISADKSTNEILLLEETEIGSLRDGRNLDFFITSAGYKFDTKDPESQYSSFTEVKKSAFDDTYGTTYTFTYSGGSTTNPDGTTLNSNYKVSLRLGLNNHIYISASKSNINPFDALNMKFTIYGTGGQISTTYNIILYNYTISSDYETASKSIYATQPINLLKDITFDSNSQSTSPAPDTDSALSLKDVSIVTDGRSYYNIGGTQRVTITSLTDNGIFRYNEFSHLINTNAVPRDTTVVLTIEVKDSYGYIVKVMEYHFTLLVNFEFVVNGETLSGNSAFTTNYILTTSNLDETNQIKQFPYSMKYNSTNDSITTIKYNNQDYYYALQLLLRNKINGEPLDISSVTIREISDFGVTIDEDNQKIILNKDITGRIILQLTLNTGNGDYSVNWNIDVLGFVTMEYRYNLGANTIITKSNGEGFTSNSTVDLANSLQTASSSGLRMTNTNGRLTEDGSITNEISLSKDSLDVKYMILPFNEYENNFNASSLFNVGSSQIASATLLSNNNIIKTTLPSVAQSTQSAREYYLVIYQVNVEYFGQVNGPYYVTYKVYNNQSVTAESDSSVNVDTSLYKSGNNQYLDLFYYMVTYETDRVTFTQYVEYNNDLGTNVVVLENGDNRYINTDSDTQYIIKRNESGGGTITINPDSESQEICTFTSQPITSGKYENGDIKSLFTSQFNSIDEFVTFINNISTIRFSNFNENGLAAESNENGYVEIELSYIGDGRFGILLYDGTNAPLKFNNQLTADLSVISNSGESEVTISAYSNGEGFRLFGSTELRANTTDITLGSIFLASELYSVESDFTLSDGMTEQIIGVGNPTSSWIHLYNYSTKNYNSITSGNIDPGESPLATFRVGDVNDENCPKYYLYQATFSSTSGNLYNLQASFYYIQTSTGNEKIVTMDYSSTFQSYFYQVNPSYSYNTAGEITFNDSIFDLAGKIKVYSMSGGVLVKNNSTPSSASEVVEQGEGYTDITIANNIATITLADETLNELMLEGRQSITIDYTCEYSIENPDYTYTLTFSIMFMIPTSGSPATPQTETT